MSIWLVFLPVKPAIDIPDKVQDESRSQLHGIESIYV